jgi:hypothetical protein
MEISPLELMIIRNLTAADIGKAIAKPMRTGMFILRFDQSALQVVALSQDRHRL